MKKIQKSLFENKNNWKTKKLTFPKATIRVGSLFSGIGAFEQALKILNDIAPEKVNLYDYSEFMIIKSGKNYKFPIHDDTPNKLLILLIIFLFRSHKY